MQLKGNRSWAFDQAGQPGDPGSGAGHRWRVPGAYRHAGIYEQWVWVPFEMLSAGFCYIPLD